VIYMILMAILALLVAIFALQNTMVVELSFLAWSFTTNLVVVIIGAAVMGMIIASLWGLKLKAQHMWRNMKKNNEISGLEEERNLLRKKVEQLTADNAKFQETIKQGLQSLDGTKSEVKTEAHKQ
jgi:uncharacterized integral membrane protein